MSEVHLPDEALADLARRYDIDLSALADEAIRERLLQLMRALGVLESMRRLVADVIASDDYNQASSSPSGIQVTSR